MFRRATQKESPDQPRRRRWGYRALIGVGVLLVAAAVTWQVRATVWTTHSNRVGQSLIQKLEKARHKAAGDRRPPKGTTVRLHHDDQRRRAPGLLVIPAIGLTAPVEEGTDDAQLNVAVGHVPTSVWPGHDRQHRPRGPRRQLLRATSTS